MSKRLLLGVVVLFLAQAGAPRLSAQSGPTGTGPNGTNPRPFYVIGHNPNTLEMAALALASGANALEPDVIVLPDGAVGGPLLLPDPPGLVMYHDNSGLTARVPLTLEEYLDGVHLLAMQFKQLAMIQLDVKPQAAKRENGPKILKAIREHLNYGEVNLNVIINVGSRIPDAELFKDIYLQLGEREGISVDGEDDPTLVVEALDLAANGNIGYGDGTVGPGPHLPKAIDWGSFLKASWGLPRTVSDVYTIANIGMMDFFIEAGADGIIPDHFLVIPPPPGLAVAEFDLASAAFVAFLAGRIPFHPEIRYATPEDNPFKPENQAYGLEVRTMDTATGGTDAPLTFTLEGCRGSAEVTVHTGIAPNGFGTLRMEANQTDHVTIPSLNLGKLTRLTIFNHGGVANAPDWDLQDVALSSARWLGPDRYNNFEYRATWNKTIEGGKTETLDLTPFFQEPEPTIECPAPITVNNAPGQCGAAVSFAPKVDGMCPDVTATSVPPSGSSFSVGTTNVTSTAASPTFPQSHPSCSFTVTVKDVELPTIACPAPMTIDATGPLGAIATFAPTSGDNCSTTVTSVPPSGSTFAIGTTTVNSTAQDPSGNQASCSFTVHVKGALEQTTDLVTMVGGLALNPGTRTSLLAKLNAALADLADGAAGSACGELAAFINEVEGKRDKEISASDADALIAKATQIRAVMGCP
jgi:HYR domain-containing protein